jgi:hypothetical protein
MMAVYAAYLTMIRVGVILPQSSSAIGEYG